MCFYRTVISSALTLVLLLPELLKVKFDFDGKMLSEMFSYSWPVLVANISFIINENSDKIFLGKLLPQSISAQQVGIYGACYKIALFLSIFYTGLPAWRRAVLFQSRKRQKFRTNLCPHHGLFCHNNLCDLCCISG